MTFKNGLRYSKWCVRKKTEVIMSVQSSSVYWRPTIFSWISLRWLFGIPLCHIVLLGLLLFHLKSLVFVAIWLLPPWFWFCFSLFLYISKLLNNVLDPSKKIFKFGVIYDSISSVRGVFSFYISLLSFKCYIFDGRRISMWVLSILLNQKVMAIL